MCGIAGFYGLTDLERLRAMVAAMRHRGPDDSGVWCDPAAGVALGNARLAIQDLSPAGHMPLTDGQRWITYNGEVYNFLELRVELEKQGHLFRSGSDTEVILAAYRQWGTDCLEHLRGMFAFAIFDPAEGGRLFLARDHFGIKPLYWAKSQDAFVFASEIRAIVASGLVSPCLDRQAVWDYLSVGSVIPPRTILAGVHALLPGHAMLLSGRDPGQLHIWRWWNLADAAACIAVPDTFEEASREVRRLLEEAIRLQRIADVPVGAFLSGGVDSSTIVGLMSAHVGQGLHTYSVAFDVASRNGDELPFAHVVARRFGTRHEEVVVTEQEVARQFDTIIDALDQPSIDGFNSYFVSQAARKGVTVALSGLGGDELFAGYPQFGHFLYASQRLPAGSELLKNTVSSVGRYLPGRWRLPLEFLAASPLERHGLVRRLFSEQEKYQLLNRDWLDGEELFPVERFYSGLLRDDLDPVAQVSYIEARGYMAHTLLRDVDVMSMAHSLEVRVPFLDHKLAEFVFALPAAWKWSDGRGKVILRHAVQDLLPEMAIARPKRGFDLPIGTWVRGVLRGRVEQVVTTKTACRLLSQRTGSMIPKLYKPQHALLAWNLLILFSWLELKQSELISR